MPRAIRITAHGGPEQLLLADAPVGEPGPGQLRQRVGAGAAVRYRHAGGHGFAGVTPQTLFAHIATLQATQAMANALFAVVEGGAS